MSNAGRTKEVDEEEEDDVENVLKHPAAADSDAIVVLGFGPTEAPPVVSALESSLRALL